MEASARTIGNAAVAAVIAERSVEAEQAVARVARESVSYTACLVSHSTVSAIILNGARGSTEVAVEYPLGLRDKLTVLVKRELEQPMVEQCSLALTSGYNPCAVTTASNARRAERRTRDLMMSTLTAREQLNSLIGC